MGGLMSDKKELNAQSFIGCFVAAIMLGAGFGLMFGAGVLVYRILT
jgi:hypothetical protein